MTSDNIKQHNITLKGKQILLRPLTENDWDVLAVWMSDPEVLWYSEGDDVYSYNLEHIQGIYRLASQTAFCFMIELDGKPIGECWLQEMNLPRILHQHPAENCQRIDLMIGEKHLWGRGYGSEVIGILTTFAFEQLDVDIVYGCEIADYNPRSLKAFLKNGYRMQAKIDQPPGGKAIFAQDVAITKQEYSELKKH